MLWAMNKRSRQPKPKPERHLPDQASQPAGAPDRPIVYQVRIKGHLDERWADAYAELSIRLEETGDTLLSLPVVDQAALYGLLRRLRDSGATLLSINPAESAWPEGTSKETRQ